MSLSLHNANTSSTPNVCYLRNDFYCDRLHNADMSKPTRPRRQVIWYLNEWLKHYGMTQADLVRKTEWSKTKVSHLCGSQQDFSSEILETLAVIFNIRPYELLMHPEESNSLKRIRNEALRIAAEDRTPYVPDGPASKDVING